MFDHCVYSLLCGFHWLVSLHDIFDVLAHLLERGNTVLIVLAESELFCELQVSAVLSASVLYRIVSYQEFIIDQLW
jgi:hypothetical protein